MARYEDWATAYGRMLDEVRAEHPDWDERTIYTEYRARCELWKQERGIK